MLLVRLEIATVGQDVSIDKVNDLIHPIAIVLIAEIS
jgi:hypothetical protein